MSHGDALESLVVEYEHVVLEGSPRLSPMLRMDAIDLFLLANPPGPFHGVCPIRDETPAVQRMPCEDLVIRRAKLVQEAVLELDDSNALFYRSGRIHDSHIGAIPVRIWLTDAIEEIGLQA